MFLFRRLFPVVALLLVGCEDARGIPGLWTGVLRTTATLLAPSRAFSFTLTLAETKEGVLSGGGRLANSAPDSLANPSQTFSLTVTGAHAHPAVSLAIVPVGVQAMNFSGSIDATLSRIDSVVYGSGFTGDSLHLFRDTPAVGAQVTAP
ncbi:MAG: hypothetical protein EXR93_04435 [Gemmatimonadetes bacterium]|nr:hypothetical protein [Gemmatimonadota bacterium]